MKHLKFPTLIDYLEDKLMANERDAIKNHLATCATCENELKMARILVNAVGGHRAKTLEPPQTLVKRAKLAFQRKQAHTTPPTLYPAALQYDSWANAASLGSRGKSAVRQVFYSISEFDLDLQVSEDEKEGVLLLGQILPNSPTAPVLEANYVEMIGRNGERRLGFTDNLGRFRFSYLAHGTYTLLLSFDNKKTMVNSLEI